MVSEEYRSEPPMQRSRDELEPNTAYMYFGVDHHLSEH